MRQEFPTKTKQQASDRANGQCERCQANLKATGGHYDHILPCALGGDNSLANCQVLCESCHVGVGGKTADDVKKIRKADRQKRRHSGAKKPKGQIKGRGFDKTAKPAKIDKSALSTLPRRSLFSRKD